MSRLHPLSRRSAVLALALFASLLSCGREVTGPGGRGALVNLQFAPSYASMIDEVDGVMHSVAELVPFTKVRIELRRMDNSVAAAQVVDFPANATEIPLAISVRLGDAAVDGAEPLTAFLRYINASGDTVFAGGPVSVVAKAGRQGQQQEPVDVPVAPTVPGAVFARIEMSPDSLVATTGQTANFTATGWDAQDVLVPNAIIGFISRNPALVAVPNLGSGSVNLVGVRGSTWLVAQSLTGVKDSAHIQILPVPTALGKVSGDAQSALTGAAFSQPLRVRVTAADGLGVADWPVSFTVTAGGGTLSADADTTDVDGFAQVTWTAGQTAGAASVTAAVTFNSLSTVFTGTQLSTAPTSLAFLTQPANITAGESLPNIQVAVRNGAGETITDFTGPVTLTLNAGATGAALVGTTTESAVAGIATFAQLSVNKGGTGFKLSATHEQLPPVQSNAFDVAAAPPTQLTVLSGGGQAAPPSTTLADSVRVRVTDTFGFAVPGQTVQFAIAQGGGALSATSVQTDADGRAAVAWTLGASGTQQLRVSLGQLEQFIGATIIAGGSVQLFAGFDYLDLRAGGSRMVPIYLTNPSPTPIDVTLSVDDSATTRLAWESASVQIPSGTTRLDVRLDGLELGTGWAYLRSSAGDDSLLVVVDSSSIVFVQTNSYDFVEGDTIRTFVRLSEPAPAGGITAIVRSDNPTVVQLAPSAGTGMPQPGCVDNWCGGEVVFDVVAAPTAPAALKAPPADTALIFIPEGQLFGEVAIIVLDDLGEGTQVLLSVEAPSFVRSERSFSIAPQYLSVYLATYGDPSLGVGVGQELLLEFALGVTRTREQRVRLESTNPAVLTVDSIAIVAPDEYWSERATVRVIAADTAYVKYWIDNVPVDSMLVVGTAAELAIDGYPFVTEGGTVDYTLRLRPLGNEYSEFLPSSPLSVTVESDNPSVLAVDRTSLTLPAGSYGVPLQVRMVAAGSANLIVSAPGYAPDTMLITSTPAYVYVSSSGTIGVDQVLRTFMELDYTAVASGSRTLNIQSLSPGLLNVMTPRIELLRDTPGAEVFLRGVAPGTATVQVSGTGVNTMQFQVQVVASELQVLATTNIPPDGVTRMASTALTANGTVYQVADTVYARLRSSNPSVVEVVDSLVVIKPGSDWSGGGSYRGIAPGSATLYLVRPNSDSASAPVTVRPFQLAQSWPSVVVGQQLETSFTLYREGPDNVELPISITQSGPGVVSFRDFTATFAEGSFSTEGRMVAESYGVDTITFTVLGYPSITRVVYVESTTVALALDDETWSVGSTYPFVYNSFSVTGVPGYPIPGKPLRFLVSALDTSAIEVVQDTIEWAPGVMDDPVRYASLRFKKAGLTSIAVTDLDGVVAGDTTEVFIYPAELWGSVGSSGNAISIGMGQRTHPYESIISRGSYSTEPLWVQLHSSDTALVQVPDSVLIPANDFYAYFELVAGDTTGSARVTASAPGYNPWQFDVLVTRAYFGFYTGTAFTDGGGMTEVYGLDAVTSTSRPFTSDIAARFTTDRPDVLDVDNATFTFPADSLYFVLRGPRALTRGDALLRIEDDRGERFDRVFPGNDGTDGDIAAVRGGTRRMLLTPGLKSLNYESEMEIRSGRDSLWVQLSAVGDKFTPLVDSVLVKQTFWLDESQAALMWSDFVPMRGLAAGTDTLVLSGADLQPDTVIVSVEPGVLRMTGSVPDIVVGDSLLLTISLLDAAGSVAAAAESLNLSVSVDTTFTVRQGGVSVGSIPVAADATSFQIWVRAEAFGPSSLTISDARFRTFTLNLNAVERP